MRQHPKYTVWPSHEYIRLEENELAQGEVAVRGMCADSVFWFKPPNDLQVDLPLKPKFEKRVTLETCPRVIFPMPRRFKLRAILSGVSGGMEE